MKLTKKVKNLQKKTSKIKQITGQWVFKPVYCQARYPLTAGLVLLLLLTMITACADQATNSPAPEQQGLETIIGEEDPIMKTEKDISELTMPPIDQDVPGNLETATLAMG